MGLLLGASVITLVELLDLIVYNSVLRCRRIRSARKIHVKPCDGVEVTTHHM